MFEKEGTFQGVVAKPWDFNGNQGIAYKATIVHPDGSILKWKINEDIYNSLVDVSQGSECVVKFNITEGQYNQPNAKAQEIMV